MNHQDEAIKTLRQIKGFFHNERVNKTVDMAIDSILGQEFGQWQKVRQENEWGTYRCSQCGEEFHLVGPPPKAQGYSYCPSCGAEMEDEKVIPQEPENAMTVKEEDYN